MSTGWPRYKLGAFTQNDPFEPGGSADIKWVTLCSAAADEQQMRATSVRTTTVILAAKPLITLKPLTIDKQG